MDQAQMDVYGSARDGVLAAQDQYAAARRTATGDDDAALTAAAAGLADAHTALTEATGPVAGLVERAWDSNVLDVQDAKMFVMVAVREQARVEVECGTAARSRNQARPVLSVDELDRCEDAAAATQVAKDMLVGAQARFKAGVTVEQLVETNT